MAGEEEAGTSSAASGGVRWERFLPKMAVRVLLVEADDSTRHVISALLRKCSYRVAAVCDGLKAWEVLKERSHNIDLILTEVELPSISGYALLSLITENDVCKHIPVIMMSSNDSVGTVYKCMLRGAADFLVKPLRKNELRNLWQHIWRRQASSIGAGPGPPLESEAQQKVEATAENNGGTSNHSSGYMACVQRNKECIDKGSDAQSSCIKPELENDNNCLSHDKNISMHENCHQESRKTRANDNEAGESHGQDKNDASGQVRVIVQNPKNDNVLANYSNEAIDLIGAFDNYLKGNLGSSASNTSINKVDILPQLDLTLRRAHHPSASVNQVNDETRRLKHSDGSAFSRYIYKPLHPCNPPSPSNQQKDHDTNSEKQFSNSNHTPDYNSDTHGHTMPSQKHISVATVQPAGTGIANFSNYTPDYNSDAHGQTMTSQKHISVVTVQPVPTGTTHFSNYTAGYNSETHGQTINTQKHISVSIVEQALPDNTFPYPQQRELSHPIPDYIVPRVYCAQVGLSPFVPTQGSVRLAEPFAHLNCFYPSDARPSSSHQLNNHTDPRPCNVDQTDDRGGWNFENVEERGNVSSVNDQSGNGNFYNGSMGHYQNNEEGLNVHEGASNRSSQREAALNKFRLKRKGRCFEKKVRYESRKKLAEQRPRVKGQFVRQATNDPQPENPAAG